MNALNQALNSTFDVLLVPLEKIGPRTTLVVVAGVFGVLALAAFKYISFQRGIQRAKDKIKGHMIEIRIYQDDLRVVASAVAKVLGRNAQYLALNFGPFIPLAIPFVFVTAQLVTRYAYRPAPVEADAHALSPGQGTLLEVRLAPGHEREIQGLSVRLPKGVVALSPLVRSAADGRAFQEIAATEEGVHSLELALANGARETKLFAAGDVSPRSMQPRRVSNADWWRISSPDDCPALWPAEPGFASSSPFRTIAISYPTRDLGWMPSGESGILIAFVVASMAFGFAAVKPLGVSI
jgi:hypothetical protein